MLSPKCFEGTAALKVRLRPRWVDLDGDIKLPKCLFKSAKGKLRRAEPGDRRHIFRLDREGVAETPPLPRRIAPATGTPSLNGFAPRPTSVRSQPVGEGARAPSCRPFGRSRVGPHGSVPDTRPTAPPGWSPRWLIRARKGESAAQPGSAAANSAAPNPAMTAIRRIPFPLPGPIPTVQPNPLGQIAHSRIEWDRRCPASSCRKVTERSAERIAPRRERYAQEPRWSSRNLRLDHFAPVTASRLFDASDHGRLAVLVARLARHFGHKTDRA